MAGPERMERHVLQSGEKTVLYRWTIEEVGREPHSIENEAPESREKLRADG